MCACAYNGPAYLCTGVSYGRLCISATKMNHYLYMTDGCLSTCMQGPSLSAGWRGRTGRRPAVDAD